MKWSHHWTVPLSPCGILTEHGKGRRGGKREAEKWWEGAVAERRRDPVGRWKLEGGWAMLHVCFDRRSRAHTKGSKVEQIII